MVIETSRIYHTDSRKWIMISSICIFIMFYLLLRINNNRFIDPNQTVSTLVIGDARVSGRFYCKAENYIGSAHITVPFYVDGK